MEAARLHHPTTLRTRESGKLHRQEGSQPQGSIASSSGAPLVRGLVLQAEAGRAGVIWGPPHLGIVLEDI